MASNKTERLSLRNVPPFDDRGVSSELIAKIVRDDTEIIQVAFWLIVNFVHVGKTSI